MLLLLIRHARAEERDATRWPDDSLRPLTDGGRKTHRRVSRALVKLGLEPEVVLASPWARAWETAEILADVMNLGSSPITCPALTTEPDLAELHEQLGTRAEASTAAMVGHSPFIEELGSILLAGTTEGMEMDFPKSGVLGLDLDRLEEGTARLRFFLRPKMIG